MPRDKSALLIIDMINRFDFQGGRALARFAMQVAPRIALLRNRFDAKLAPVIYVNDNFAEWQGEFRELVSSCKTRGGASSAVLKAVEPRSGDYYILKPKHSAFLATALDVLLAKLDVQRLVLTGLSADSCILATAHDANMREFHLWTPPDCIAARSPALKKQALFVLKGARVANTSTTRVVQGLFPEAE